MHIDGPQIGFEAIAETLTLTTLDELVVDRQVSVERSCRIGDELGGHDVFGHIVGTGHVLVRAFVGEQLDITIGVPPAWYEVHPGQGLPRTGRESSLRRGQVSSDRFDVHLIPETQRLTSFADKAVGQR